MGTGILNHEEHIHYHNVDSFVPLLCQELAGKELNVTIRRTSASSRNGNHKQTAVFPGFSLNQNLFIELEQTNAAKRTVEIRLIPPKGAEEEEEQPQVFRFHLDLPANLFDIPKDSQPLFIRATSGMWMLSFLEDAAFISISFATVVPKT